jgi:inhibitor of KinA sporulation pathway (predicted exonuclease)
MKKRRKRREEMIAFLDVEYNTDDENQRRVEDMSIIEVGLIVVDDIENCNVIDTYHTFVKPIKNNGLLYDRILQLTTISQEDIDKCNKTFPNVLDDITNITKKYDIKKIYVFGDFDKRAIRWNCRLYDNIQSKNFICKKIFDISKEFEKQLEIEDSISLKNLAYVCEIEVQNQHCAFNDADLLRKITKNMFHKDYNIERLKHYIEYAYKRKKYAQLRNIINQLDSNDVRYFVDMAMSNMKFYDFC